MNPSIRYQEVMDLLLLHSRLTKKLDKAMRRFDLTLTRFRVLAEIHRLHQPRTGFATAASIGKSMDMNPKSIFDCVEDMKRKGWVSSQPQDGRANRLRLTPTGRSKFHTGAVVWEDVLNLALPNISEELRQEISRAIGQANEFFHEEVQVARHTSDLRRTKLKETREAIEAIEARRKAGRTATNH